MIGVINSAGANAEIGISAACGALNVARSTFYRWRHPAAASLSVRFACRVPGRRRSAEEEAQVLSELNSDRFIDKAPPQIYAILLDEGAYLCSVSTMYRTLHKHGEVKDRRRRYIEARPMRLLVLVAVCWIVHTQFIVSGSSTSRQRLNCLRARSGSIGQQPALNRHVMVQSWLRARSQRVRQASRSCHAIFCKAF